MSQEARDFHEQWLGMAQPTEGLVVSIPALVDAQCYDRKPLATTDRLRELALAQEGAQGDAATSVPLEDLLFDPRLLAFERADFEGLDDRPLPEDLQLWVPEGHQRLAPTLALRRTEPRPLADGASAARTAGASYDLLVWRLPPGLSLQDAETETGSWDYPPTAKFDRLLRHTGVPIGLLTNDQEYRLLYAPRGETSGWISFRISEMATPAGRPLLDAFLMLLGQESFVHRPPESRLPAILEDSRKRQAQVTEALADQVFRALTLLLEGFEAAAERGQRGVLEEALQRSDDHVYGGLLTVLLRQVFVLYAEDRNLLPTDSPLYQANYSLLGLFDQLQSDAGEFPDSMDRRFGAWDRMMALFWAIYSGVDARLGADHFTMPRRRGGLFDPDRYPFLEGRVAGASPTGRCEVNLPQIDDRTVYEMLQQLVILEGQRLSYRTLDVEQIGSVYEALMGYHVVRVQSQAVYLKLEAKKAGIWVESAEVLRQPANRRASWLQNEVGFSRAHAKRVAAALKGAETEEQMVERLRELSPRGAEIKAANRLVLQPGTERRRTSSHYTPRSFSGPIVRRTLEPLLRTLGEEPSPEQLLELKICDPAMGSGAFLVEACRVLAEEVEKAWTRQGLLEQIHAEHGDVQNHARRLVAQRCLYGVDKNPFAVDLAKLSLWLETLAEDLPFTFLDHALRAGDSLVGLDFDQIRGFHWQPAAQQDLASKKLEEALDEAIGLRQKILQLAGQGPAVEPEKQYLLEEAEDASKHARLIADLVVGAFFAHPKKKAREQELGERLALVSSWLEAGGGEPPEELTALQEETRERLQPFHWMLEFPEIFYADRPDPLDGGTVNHAAFIDAVVGNPPFLGGKSISTNLGDDFSEWLETINCAGKNGDLSAHFFRLADRLLGSHGAIGLIATNSIAQGDTRAAGLQRLVASGLEIYDVSTAVVWPGSAAVVVSIVHLAKGHPIDFVRVRRFDGIRVHAINSRLRPKSEWPEPSKLFRNLNLSFVGSYVNGIGGFSLNPVEREELLAQDPRNSERIFPYLGGEEINSSPTQSHHRYVINFGDLSLSEAETWPSLIEILIDKVKPKRDRVKRKAHREFWWQYGDKRPALYRALVLLGSCIVTSRVSKHLAFSLVATGPIFSEAVCVIASDRLETLAILQSRIHEFWARLQSSSMKTDLRYSVSDCFETFPFPETDPRVALPRVETLGQETYEARARYLLDSDEGLTDCYNRLKDPRETDDRIRELRRLHVEMDRAVLDAYGWSDIDVPPYTDPETDDEQRVRQAFEDEVIDRLFVLNAERAAEERRAAARVVKKGSKASGGSGQAGQGKLFE